MDYSAASDAALVSAYLKNDEQALPELINRHQQRIFSFVISKVHSQALAEDIFQETFFKVIRTLKRGSYNEEGKFLPWVMRIAHNLVIDYFRKNKRMPTISPTDEFDIFDLINNGEENVESKMIDSQIEQDLHILIEQLPAEQLEVLKMRQFAGMSFKDIAEQTDVSINTALGRMRYAIINLRKLIEANKMSLSKQ
jgi:RNA polymerase sigma-70 factor (ECF subfamily)